MLNDNIKYYRKKLGLTQVELAEKLNVSQSTITSWENGNRRPDLDFLPVLAQIFGISIDDLLGPTPDTVIVGAPPVGDIKVVYNDPWDVETAFSDPQDDSIRIMARGMGRLSPENRQKLLDVAKTLFSEDFDEEGNKK